MALNDPYAPGVVRAPRMQILNNGEPIIGAMSFTINNNNYYQADTFSCEFAFNADPAHNLSFWGDPAWDTANPLMLDIQASLDGGTTFTSFIIGQTDHITVHLEKGIVHVDGRDRTATLIDNKTNYTFQNLTASQVVQQVGAQFGFDLDVTPTTTLVGRYYEMDHERIGAGEFTHTTTYWNLLCSFAAKEQYDIYVTGNTLHFNPTTPPDSDPYVVVWDQSGPYSNAIEITTERSLTYAKDVVVVVRSWDSKTGKAVIAYAPSGARQSSIASGKAQEFFYTFPNLSKGDAQDQANKIRADLTAHERLISFAVPADLTLNARNMLSLQGTGSSFDQTYFVDSVERSMHWEGGFTMHVKGKNKSPVSSVPASG